MSTYKNCLIEDSTRELTNVLESVQWRRKVWDNSSPLEEAVPRFLNSAPVGTPEILWLLSRDSHRDVATYALDLAYARDPIYTVTDCFWIFSGEWDRMLDTSKWKDYEIASWYKSAMIHIDQQHIFKYTDSGYDFINNIFLNTNDSYLRGRAAFFLLYEFNVKTQKVRDSAIILDFLPGFSDSYEECQDSSEPDSDDRPIDAPSERMVANNWSDGFDDFDGMDWQDYMGGPDDDDFA